MLSSMFSKNSVASPSTGLGISGLGNRIARIPIYSHFLVTLCIFLKLPTSYKFGYSEMTAILLEGHELFCSILFQIISFRNLNKGFYRNFYPIFRVLSATSLHSFTIIKITQKRLTFKINRC